MPNEQQAVVGPARCGVDQNLVKTRSHAVLIQCLPFREGLGQRKEWRQWTLHGTWATTADCRCESVLDSSVLSDFSDNVNMCCVVNVNVTMQTFVDKQINCDPARMVPSLHAVVNMCSDAICLNMCVPVFQPSCLPCSSLLTVLICVLVFARGPYHNSTGTVTCWL